MSGVPWNARAATATKLWMGSCHSICKVWNLPALHSLKKQKCNSVWSRNMKPCGRTGKWNRQTAQWSQVHPQGTGMKFEYSKNRDFAYFKSLCALVNPCLSSGSGRNSKDFCVLPLHTGINMVPTRLLVLLQGVGLSSWIRALTVDSIPGVLNFQGSKVTLEDWWRTVIYPCAFRQSKMKVEMWSFHPVFGCPVGPSEEARQFSQSFYALVSTVFLTGNCNDHRRPLQSAATTNRVLQKCLLASHGVLQGVTTPAPT